MRLDKDFMKGKNGLNFIRKIFELKQEEAGMAVENDFLGQRVSYWKGV